MSWYLCCFERIPWRGSFTLGGTGTRPTMGSSERSTFRNPLQAFTSVHTRQTEPANKIQGAHRGHVIVRHQWAERSAVTDNFTAQSLLQSLSLVLTRRSAFVLGWMGRRCYAKFQQENWTHRSSGQLLAAAVISVWPWLLQVPEVTCIGAWANSRIISPCHGLGKILARMPLEYGSVGEEFISSYIFLCIWTIRIIFVVL